MADKRDVRYGLGRHTYIYNDYCIIANYRSTVHQVRELRIYRDQGTYLTIGWRRREVFQIPQEESER